MTDSNYTHYVLVIDRSGSMHSIRADAQGGINQFIKDQIALPGRATLSLYDFNWDVRTVFNFRKLSPEDNWTYRLGPSGGTALLDAVGFAVTEVGEKLDALPEAERPGKVVVLITTDGEENSSREYTLAQVKKLVTRQQDKYGWQFSYIGANVDAFANGASLGIGQDQSLSYAATPRGTKMSMAAASAATSRYVAGGASCLEYTSTEREAAADSD
jgi:hypothetical protein